VLAALAAAPGPRLTLLSIEGCDFLDGLDGLSAFASLKSLRHLHLDSDLPVCQRPSDPDTDSDPDSDSTSEGEENEDEEDEQENGHQKVGQEQQRSAVYNPGNLLSVLVQLTHLSIGVSGFSLKHLSCLTNLQELRLPHGASNVQPSDLPAPQRIQQLTHLKLAALEFELSTSPAPDLYNYTLTHLELKVTTGFDAALQSAVKGAGATAVLGPLAQLQRLHLYRGHRGGALTTIASRAVLAHLAQMAQLTHLQLECEFDKDTPPVAFSAITASSKLQYLALQRGRGWHCEQVSFEALWSHAFPAGRQLSHLRTLKVAGCTDRGTHAWIPEEVSLAYDQMAYPGWFTETQPVGQDSDWKEKFLYRLASCCPRLQHLDAVQALQGQVSLAPLLQLHQLTSLSVQHVSDADAGGVLAQLPGLQRLVVGYADRWPRAIPGCITADGLNKLSALTALTHLSLTGHKKQDRSCFDHTGQYEWADKADMAYRPFCLKCWDMAIVAGLTSLRVLKLRDHADISDEGILQLTALGQLTRLLVERPSESEYCCWSYGSDCEPEPRSVDLPSQVSAGVLGAPAAVHGVQSVFHRMVMLSTRPGQPGTLLSCCTVLMHS
jgi:hypothetical protein